MKSRSVLHFLITTMLALALGASVSGAEETQEERIEQLERRQQELLDEMRQMREEMRRRNDPLDGTDESTNTGSNTPRIKEVERKQGVLTREVARLREALVLPEKKELKSVYGLGPAASKVYLVDQGLSIGGYGEAHFRNQVSDKAGSSDQFDFLRFVLYFGYKYNDWIILNSELEFEHASSSSTVSAGNGSVSVEFATIDFLLHPRFNIRGGMLLAPVGFVNLIHEPPFFLGNRRPPVERQIIPTTWRANGAGLFGEIAPGLTYSAYAVTSFNAVGFSKSNLRGGRQKGNRERANDWSFVGRLDYEPIANWGWTVAGSAYVGDQGQGERIGPAEMRSRPDVFTQLYEVHTQVQRRNFHFRALGTTVLLDDAGILSADPDIAGPIGKMMLGAYAEVGYDILPHILPDTTHSLMPWFRYSWLDSQAEMPRGFARDRKTRRDFWEFGVNYKPIPQVVLKAEYRIEDRAGGSLPDGLQVGGGFVF